MNTKQHTNQFVETLGEGDRVVLVHGSLATGAEEWVEQHSLANRGFQLLMLDRRGYGRSPGGPGEDFLADASDVAELIGDGAHVVGHSYGGLGALLGAARRPEATRSLTLLEPALPASVTNDPSWRAFVSEVARMWESDASDREWVVGFLKAVGSDPDQFPAEMLDTALPLVPLLRHGRAFHQADIPLEQLRLARFPKLVVSGGHHPGFDAVCRDLAEQISGDHRIVAGAGHEIQFTGEPLNELLVSLWRPVICGFTGG